MIIASFILAQMIVPTNPLIVYSSTQKNKQDMTMALKVQEKNGAYWAYVRGCGNIRVFTNKKGQPPKTGLVKADVKKCVVEDWSSD